jgi:hypothetical protein
VEVIQAVRGRVKIGSVVIRACLRWLRSDVATHVPDWETTNTGA